MRLRASIEGDLEKVVAAEWRAAGRAIRAGLGEAGKGLRGGLRADARRAGLGRLGRVWRSRVFRGRRGPAGSMALVYPKAGRRAREALWAFEHGATIRARRGRYLAIPTGFNKPRGHRKSKGGPLVSVKEMVAMKKWTYVRPTKDGLVWFLRVTEAREKSHGGRVVRRAFAGGMKLGGRARGDVGFGRGRRVGRILERGAVPMFMLLPKVRVNKRTDIAGSARHWRDRLPELVVKHWNEEGRK
jgi:hypothetical protein